MKAFNEDTACPKCGWTWATRKLIINKDVIGDEAMQRVCVCGYAWYELPLDHEEKSE